MENNKRTKYSKDFKEQAIRMVLDQGLTRAEVGRKLGIHQCLIGSWVKEFTSKGSESFSGNGKLPPKDEEIRKLKEEIRQLRMERDFLKKQQYSSPRNRCKVQMYCKKSV